MAADPLRVLTSRTRHPFEAIDYPAVPAKPRTTAVTSVIDGGLGPAEARDRVAVARDWIDVVKLGWATARLTPDAALREKIQIYRAAGIHTCTGGTFLEIAFAQNRVREFLDGARDLGLSMVEVSNGVHPMSDRGQARTYRPGPRGGVHRVERGRQEGSGRGRPHRHRRPLRRDRRGSWKPAPTRLSSRRANRAPSASTTALAAPPSR